MKCKFLHKTTSGKASRTNLLWRKPLSNWVERNDCAKSTTRVWQANDNNVKLNTIKTLRKETIPQYKALTARKLKNIDANHTNVDEIHHQVTAMGNERVATTLLWTSSLTCYGTEVKDENECSKQTQEWTRARQMSSKIESIERVDRRAERVSGESVRRPRRQRTSKWSPKTGLPWNHPPKQTPGKTLNPNRKSDSIPTLHLDSRSSWPLHQTQTIGGNQEAQWGHTV